MKFGESICITVQCVSFPFTFPHRLCYNQTNMFPLTATTGSCFGCFPTGNGDAWGAFAAGTYSDEWWSESSYINDAWVMTDGLMKGSGNNHDEWNIQEDWEREREVFLYHYLRTEHQVYEESNLYSSLHVIDETFTVSQTVVNGVWVVSDKFVTITDTMSSSKQTESIVVKDNADNLGAQICDTSFVFESTDYTSTKEYDLTGLVSSSWSGEWHKYSTVGYLYTNPYGERHENCNTLEYDEYRNSSGYASGRYYYGEATIMPPRIFFTKLTDVTLDGTIISGGYYTGYPDGSLWLQYTISSGYFRSNVDPSTQPPGVHDLTNANPPAAPPPPPAKPEVAKVNYENPARSWWNISGRIYDAVHDAINDVNNMERDAQERAKAYTQLSDMSDVNKDTNLSAFLPYPKSVTNTAQRFAEGYVNTAGMVLPSLTATRGATAVVGVATTRGTHVVEAMPNYLPNQVTTIHVGVPLPHNLNYSVAAKNRMSDPNRYVSQDVLKNCIRNGLPLPDPQGSSAIMHYGTMIKNEKTYNIEVLYDYATNTVLHFLYSRKPLGPLPKIVK